MHLIIMYALEVKFRPILLVDMLMITQYQHHFLICAAVHIYFNPTHSPCVEVSDGSYVYCTAKEASESAFICS